MAQGVDRLAHEATLPMTERAHVLGGGIAGIHAALLLREKGFDVTLLESRSMLGGRVFSLPEPHGDRIDNGPHVMIGAYDAMRALLRRLGTELDFVPAPRLCMDYVEHGGRMSRLLLSRWPVPLAMPAAVLRLGNLPLAVRLRMLRGLTATVWPPGRSLIVEDWLLRHGQQGAPSQFLFEPLCHAIMNAAPAEVSARLFLATLRRAFSGAAARAALWIPRRPWSEIVGEPAQRVLAARSIQVQLGTRVTGFSIGVDPASGQESLHGIQLASGREIGIRPGDLVVSALPWHGLRPLLAAHHRSLVPDDTGMPIVSVYFDDAAPVPFGADGCLTALVGGDPFHFVYRRPQAPDGRFAVLSGGSRAFDGKTVAVIEDLARRQLGRYFPSLDVTKGRARVVKEARATWLASPQAAEARPLPGPFPGVAGLHVCGDWTRTGLPATLEGAAWSAQAVVEGLASR